MVNNSELSNINKQFIFFQSHDFLTKEQFTFNERIEGLDPHKSILVQKEVQLNYKDDTHIMEVSAKHGVVTLFKDGNEYFLLGIPTENPETKTLELKASIGGTEKAEYSVTIFNSLKNEVMRETNCRLSLEDFHLSSYYVCHREPNWGEWSVCFIKAAALTDQFDLDKLKEKVQLINAELKNSTSIYGIYELKEVVKAAGKTAGLPESADKEKTKLINRFSGTEESWVIFDDNAIDKLFYNMKPEHFFKESIAEINTNPVNTGTKF